MNANYFAAITNTLKSSYDPNDPQAQKYKIQNNLPIPLFGYFVGLEGQHSPITIFGAQGTSEPIWPLPAGGWILWTDVVQGAFLGLTQLNFGPTEPTTFVVDTTTLLNPGDIGPIPSPNADVLLPDDSTPVVVGCGPVVNGYLIRVQYYHCTTDSYCLPAGETRTVGITTTSGMQSISSDLETTASSLSTSASAGWGPVSASTSYSLSQSSTTFQQYTISEETTRYDQVTLTNPTDHTIMYYCWQMQDMVTVFSINADGRIVPTAALVSARLPQVFSGPFDPSHMPPAPDPTAPSPESERQLFEGMRRPFSPLPRVHR